MSSTHTSQAPSSVTNVMPSSTGSQVASSSVSTSSATTSQTQLNFVSRSTPTQYHVFLSFRGKDTRFNFTSHLYQRLDDHGIRTFMDDPELRGGEVISDALIQAIHESMTYIVVFSENYATSSWCLNELVEILNCHKKADRLIIPVFYKIDASVVRHQIGSFKEAFEKHQVRVEMEKVNKWRLTLTEAAEFSGFYISETRSEADIINQIVDEILPNINSMDLDVAKYPVGLDSPLKVLTTLLDNGREEGFTKIGIYGMGGVGKTTLAKALFNQLLKTRSFKGSCFLANVREVSRTFKGIESLQQQFINNVLKSKNKIEVDNVEKGIMLVKERICSTKVLLLIDDVDDPRQYESLVGSFALGSVVITTTRDQDILDKIEVEPKFQYMVNELDDADSLALFTRHAFRNAEQNNTLMVLSTNILRHAGGLPLALEVFGSYLYNKSEVGWKSYIEKLQRVTENSIQQKLKISLDAIELDDPMLKKIFLDIACFFTRMEKRKLVKILETYYHFADHKIDILQKKCLVKINYNAYLGIHELEMHDLLRDMGRATVRNISPDEPGKQSRLWVSEDVYYVLKTHKGTESIEGIFADNLDHQHALEGKSFSIETFKRMSKLRFLYLKYVNLTGSFEQTFEDLRWFCWEHCPFECLPFEFYPQKLVILELPYSNMKSMWELNMVSHVFGKLRTLKMAYSKNLITTPDFSKFPYLETLNLQFCESLEEIHMSIGSLASLVSLDLLGCVKLRSLPDTICNLGVLEVLNLYGCTSLRVLPTELGNIKSLTNLIAGELCLTKLPESIGHLTKLVVLDLRYNEKLETLPNTICNLRSLEILNIERCSGLEALPMAIGNIESLKKIEVRDLTVSKLPESIGSLTKLVELDLSFNKELETLPDTVCNLRSLDILKIDGCEKLEILPDQLWKMTRLRELSARSTFKLQSFQIASSLQKLELSSSGIKALPSCVSQLSNLKEINAYGCFSLERLRLSNLKHLETLNLQYCTNLTEIQGLEELTALRQLDLVGCSGLTHIQDLEKLTSIRLLGLDGLNSLVPQRHLTKRLFQVYSEFGHRISVVLKGVHGLKSHLQWPNWMIESPYWTRASESTTMYAHLLPNESHNFMGFIICFDRYISESSRCDFSVKSTTSGFIWSEGGHGSQSKMMVMVPKSMFSITDEDHGIEFTTDNLRFLGIHLLYKTETEMIDDVEKHESSFNALKLVDPVLQDIFLDIACFFIGWHKKKVIQILETYYSNVDRAIEILQNCCLLTINDRDELNMIDLLLHIGRKIVCNNAYDEPGRHSRLWLSTDIYDVLKEHKGTDAIQGMIPHQLDSRALEGESFTMEMFTRMSKLRFLYLSKVNLAGSFEQAFQELRWFCWVHCPLKCLPSEFYPQKLVILELLHSEMRTMWEPNMVSHVFEKLTTLNMDYSLHLTTSPNFTELPCLEVLSLTGCESLEEVHKTIGSLVNLVSLGLKGCVRLRSLPDTICKLRALELLDISDCSCLEALPLALGNIQSLRALDVKNTNVPKLPDSIGHLTKLVELNLRCSRYLQTLPHTFCDLKALEALDISDCSCLEALPTGLGNIQSLKELNAENLAVLELPDSVGGLSKLVWLRLSGNKNLETLPDTICNLRSLEILDISGCEKLEILPDQLCMITSLRELIAGGATLLKRFPYVASQITLSLQKLDFSEWGLTALPSSISKLPNLENLNLKDCRCLLSIAELPLNLKWIRADGCTSMERLPNLSNLKQLEYLNLEDCSGLTEIQGLKELTSITRLHLEGCNSSLLSYILTENFFQMYSQFGNPIQIYAPFPDWISLSSECLSTMWLDVASYVSHHFSGMILCFDSSNLSDGFLVRSFPSNYMWSGRLDAYSKKSIMVIVPNSIFSVQGVDDKILLMTKDAIIHGIHHLPCKTEECSRTSQCRLQHSDSD
ncbi:TMV resistance protein N-like isoform X2 [Daucus carota subsp. sativus]